MKPIITKRDGSVEEVGTSMRDKYIEPLSLVDDNEQDKEIEKSTSLDILKSHLADRLDFYEIVEKPEPVIVLEIEGKEYEIGTADNFGVITGKAKSKKTKVLTLLISAFFKNNANGRILYIDTEMSKYHVSINARMMKEQAGEYFDDKRIDLLMWKSLGADTKQRKLTEILKLNLKAGLQGYSLIVIDGIRDFQTASINDQEGAVLMAEWLNKIVNEYHTHIITILHQNKAEENRSLRGALGTELTNKCEYIIEVEKDKQEPAVSYVSMPVSRDLPFESFKVRINEDELCEVVGGYKKPVMGKPKKKNLCELNPDVYHWFTDELHKEYTIQEFKQKIPVIITEKFGVDTFAIGVGNVNLFYSQLLHKGVIQEEVLQKKGAPKIVKKGVNAPK